MQERQVTVQDMLAARDERAGRQAVLLRRHHQPVISFTMNIAGPVKTDEQIRRAFAEGERQIRAHLAIMKLPVLDEERRVALTGCEALWSVAADAAFLKERMAAIEESCPLGRLFDIDVIDAQGQHLSRMAERPCLICGGSGRACARSRAHSAQALFDKAHEIIDAHFRQAYASRIAQYAQRALLYEALTTPKPGLVDCASNGAHQDMNLFSFADSTSVLGGYFEECVRIGQAGKPLSQLQQAGVMAEQAMWDAAKVNTHKGAIFALGILCCAAGRCGETTDVSAILAEAGRIGQYFLAQADTLNPDTGGMQQRSGPTGARGEAAGGFPSVRDIALPTLEAALRSGLSLPDAGKKALLALMAHVKDSNILRRAGMPGQQWVMAEASRVLAEGVSDEALRELDAEMIRRHISPGGSADLLAATYFLHLISRYGGD